MLFVENVIRNIFSTLSIQSSNAILKKIPNVLLIAIIIITLAPKNIVAGDKVKGFESYGWTEINDNAQWSPRAGLETVALGRDFYLLGGRTPNPYVPPPEGPIPGDSTIHGDVWKSSDRGATWELLLETDDFDHWPARAYHEVVTMGRQMYILGGQNFGSITNPSRFFNDVWSSFDGIYWTELTPNAPWAGRAGLSAIVFKGEIYIMGGSYNDAFGGPPRVLLNDVWKSRNGIDWEELTDDAPWAPRAGAAVVVRNGFLYLIGGEYGFTGFPPPYFNDVWRTSDGIEWQLVTGSAEWEPRPGHTCDVLRNTIVCFGGFGQSTDPSDPFKPSNPMDVWVSADGAHWKQVSDSPWNAESPADIKYDYDTIVAPAGRDGRGQAIYTFGGDRETFDFFDPTQWLNVDNDVWRFYLPKK